MAACSQHDHDHRPIVHDDHPHDHQHDHVHETHRRPQQRRLSIAIVLTGTMAIAEVIGGIVTGSLALLSDAVHMASHLLALAVSYVAIRLAQRTVNRATYPFGLLRIEVLAAFLNGALLLPPAVLIVWEALERATAPVAVRGMEMTVIAWLGLAVNLTTAWVLRPAARGDRNTRSAFRHLLTDTLSSVIVVGSGIAIWCGGPAILDPLASAVIVVFVLRWAWSTIREAGSVLLERAPRDLNVATLTLELKRSNPAIVDVHDVHVWEITDGLLAMTAHIVLPADTALSRADLIRMRCSQLLRERYRIAHATLQMELER
jgi:cobalt-zinc-cadmium efflux system protein